MSNQFYGVSQKEISNIYFNIQRNLYLIRKYFGNFIESAFVQMIEVKYNIKLDQEYLLEDLLSNGDDSNTYAFLKEYYEGNFNNSIKEFLFNLKKGDFESLNPTHKKHESLDSIIEEIEGVNSKDLQRAKLELYSINKQNYNDFISEFCSYIVNNVEREKPDNIFVENKDMLLAFINMTILTQLNKEFSASELELVKKFFGESTTPEVLEVNKLRELNNGEKDKQVTRAEVLLSEITNAFSHTGELYWNGNLSKIRMINYGKFLSKDSEGIRLSVDFDIQYFNNAVEQISSLRSNGIIPLMRGIGEKIKNNKFEDITKVEGISMMLYLLFNFNKESTFDKYISNQYSLVDASKFRVTYGKNSLDSSDYKKMGALKDCLFIFANPRSKSSFVAEWFLEDNSEIGGLKDIVRIKENSNNESLTNSESDIQFSNVLLYDIDKQPFATDISKHIPSPELIRHLRNAVRHGNIEYDKGIFKFCDQDKNGNKYFQMEIAVDDLTKFLDSDIFQEVIDLSPIENSKLKKDASDLYYSEEALSKNSFSKYMEILMYSFPDKTLSELVGYMYENGMFSRYIANNPERYEEVLLWTDGHGKRLMEYLQRFASDNFKEKGLFFKYEDYLKLVEQTKRGLTKEFEFGEPDLYYKAYYNSLKNAEKKKNFIKFNYTSSEKLEMSETFSKTCEVFGKKYDSYELNKMVTLAMLEDYRNGLSEFDKIFYAIYSSIDLQNKYGKKGEKKYSYKTWVSGNEELLIERRRKILEIAKQKSEFINDSVSFLIKLISTGMVTLPFLVGNIEFIYNNIDLFRGIYMFTLNDWQKFYEFSKTKKTITNELLDEYDKERKPRIF